jgi:hypothetical protein
MAVEPFLGTRAQRAFILFITIQAVVVLVMVAIVFRLVERNVPDININIYRTIPCYLALFALAEIFELLMAFDALRLRNIIQLIGILLFHVGLIVMAALQVSQTRKAVLAWEDCEGVVSTYCDDPSTLWRKVQPFLVVVPCVLALSWFTILFWVKELYAEFGWAIFHVVGADRKFKTMYQFYQVMVCLLKFDFFAFTGVTMQLLIVVLKSKSAGFILTIIAIPVVLVLLAFCGTALKREIKWLMTASLILMVASMSYFVYKLIRFYQPYHDSKTNPYLTTRATLTMFTISALLLLICTFAVGIRCFADFDKGLLQAKTDDVTFRNNFLPALPSPGRGNMSEQQSSYIGGSQMSPRLSIE